MAAVSEQALRDFSLDIAADGEAAEPSGRPGRELMLDTRCISVQVGAGLYALRLQDVQEVMALKPMTRVFHAPPSIAGVTNLRGEVLPVLDLGVLLGGEAAGRGLEGRVLVVRDGEKRRAGLLVDALFGLREIPKAGLAPLPATLSEEIQAFAEGLIGDKPSCLVLRVQSLLQSVAEGARVVGR